MEEKDILDASKKIMLFTWLNNLFQSKNAEFNPENKSIIDLNVFASSFFCLGRDNETLEGFIGIPKHLLPWFAQIGFRQAVYSPLRRRLFLSCGNEFEEGFTISLKVRLKRALLIWHKDNKSSDVKSLDFRMFSIKADRTISLSEKVIHTVPLILSDDLQKVSFEINNVKESKEDIYAEQIRENFKKVYYSKYIDVNEVEDEDDEW